MESEYLRLVFVGVHGAALPLEYVPDSHLARNKVRARKGAPLRGSNYETQGGVTVPSLEPLAIKFVSRRFEKHTALTHCVCENPSASVRVHTFCRQTSIILGSGAAFVCTLPRPRTYTAELL